MKEKNKTVSEDKEIELTNGMLIVVEQRGVVIKATVKSNGDVVTSKVPLNIRKKALNQGKEILHNNGDFKVVEKGFVPKVPENLVMDMAFVHSSYQYKPKDLIINELKWKYLMRNIYRGKNILLTGMSGSGKTKSAFSAANTLNRCFFYINLGATQDPRATLIGNTHYSKEKGTYFSPSKFVEAIQTEDAVILLDELSRAHPEAWNILMTILDEDQRYLRLDESEGQREIKVAKGVSFIATANVGSEYTSTRVFDRALSDRFKTVEMDLLTEDEEVELLTMLYPDVDTKTIKAIAKIADETRKNIQLESPDFSTCVSTRMTVEIGEIVKDGFKLTEAMEVCVLPFYDNTGGAASERHFVKQLIQKSIPVDEDDKDLMNAKKEEETDGKISSDNPFQ
ncbi:hypothetical protein COB55_03640 [Candidatus Wolfebacteria bacterium]|nr:MAG: hypothetical protein COB55_03640 [Candidatus Wolfebacteria bacterium]